MLLGIGEIPAAGTAGESQCLRVPLYASGGERYTVGRRTSVHEGVLSDKTGLPDLQRIRYVAIQEAGPGHKKQGSAAMEARHAPGSALGFRDSSVA